MQLYQIDAFTDQPFHGNPACVCILDQPQDDAWMQSLSAEMNLSETAFVLKQSNGFGLRWFTPTKEVSLCGHATLASAHILWEDGCVPPAEKIEFHTLSGLLTIRKDGPWIEMDFPARLVSPADPNSELNQALGITPTHTSKRTVEKGAAYLLEVETEEIVRTMMPDFARLLATDARTVIVTSRSGDAAYDFVSRFFGPAIGINEDPVTGSAHCYLAPYWSARLNKHSLLGLQVSKRAGVVGCEWKGERILLRGQAVTIFKGELLGSGTL
jgi:PhzF family phenazine biosynthesis protein